MTIEEINHEIALVRKRDAHQYLLELVTYMSHYGNNIPSDIWQGKATELQKAVDTLRDAEWIVINTHKTLDVSAGPNYGRRNDQPEIL